MIKGYCQAVRHSTLTAAFVGSNPTSPVGKRKVNAMTVNVLGTIYTIRESNKVDNPNLDGVDGYCDSSTKTIVIDTFKDSPGSLEDLDAYRRQVIRHELVHAFLFESGLDACSWARNEEIVDWMAIQFPKLLKVFKEIDLI